MSNLPAGVTQAMIDRHFGGDDDDCDVDDEKCPACGAPTVRLEADVGVGTIYGPRQCTACVWTDAPTEDDLPDSPPLEDDDIAF